MELALTFGSVGDIIAVCKLAIQLRHALKSGSAKEFQDLRQDLDTFVRILIEIVETYERQEDSPWLHGLDQTAKSVVDECMSTIVEILDRTQRKYGDSLGPHALGRRAKDVYRKIEWSMKEKELIIALKELLRTNTQRLTLLVAAATLKTNRVNNDTLQARLAAVEGHVCAGRASNDEILGILREQIATQDHHREQQMECISIQLKKAGCQILGPLQRTLTAVCEIKDMIGNLTQAVLSLQVSASFLQSLDPMGDQPVILEDSMRRPLRIPPEWIESLDWETLHKLIECRFKGAKGYQMVQDRAYAFEDSVSGHELDKLLPLPSLLRRGMQINMTMLFHRKQWLLLDGNETRFFSACPRCHRITTSWAVEAAIIQCGTSRCGMIFSSQIRLVELHREAYVNLVFEIPTNSDPDASVAVESDAISPADFQRVRLLHMQYQPNPGKPKPGQEDLADLGELPDELAALQPYPTDSGPLRQVSRRDETAKKANDESAPKSQSNKPSFSSLVDEIKNEFGPSSWSSYAELDLPTHGSYQSEEQASSSALSWTTGLDINHPFRHHYQQSLKDTTPPPRPSVLEDTDLEQPAFKTRPLFKNSHYNNTAHYNDPHLHPEEDHLQGTWASDGEMGILVSSYKTACVPRGGNKVKTLL